MEEPELQKRYTNRERGLDFFLRRADAVADEVGNLWHMEAACSKEDPELWFPGPKRTKESRASTAKAVSICFNECPVRLQCLKAACVAKEPAGIWGGLDFSTRRGDSIGRKAHDYDTLSEMPNPCE